MNFFEKIKIFFIKKSPNMSIRYNNKTIKLLEHRTLVQGTVDAKAGKGEISTNNIDVLLNNHIGNLFCRKDFLQMLYPYLAIYITNPRYRGKKVNFFYDMYRSQDESKYKSFCHAIYSV